MTLPSETVTLPGSGLVFINTYGTAVTAAYRSAALAAESFFQSHFIDSVTVNVDFEFSALGAKFSASNSFSTDTVGYAALVQALQAHAVTADDRLAVAGLPATDPSHGLGFGLSTPEAEVLGLAPQTNKVDLTVTLNSSLAWSFGQDAAGALEHEISEGAFGRVASLGVQASTWAPLDLFRFAASGQRDLTGGSDGVATFFGVDSSHVGALAYHNSVSATGVDDGFDLGDWDSTVGDAFGPGGPNAPGKVSATDLQVLDVLGWTPTGAAQYAPAPDDFANSLTDTTHPFGALAAGGSASGALQTAGDRDWFKVQLFAGFTYTLTETGHTGGGGTLADPYLRLDDASGAVVAQNDDIVSGSNPDSRLTFTPSASGTFYVEAGAYQDGYTGSYTLGLAASVALPAQVAQAISGILRASPTDPDVAALASQLSVGLTAGSLNAVQAVGQIVQAAEATSSVATLAYEFFTGGAPTSGGMDFLVSPTGPNPSNLNSAYYQGFNLENRYINFAVNLGKGGAGAAAFQAAYGALSLSDATAKAYQTIFGGAPSAAKVAALLDPTLTVGGATLTRADYFALYGGDGPNGLGTKAAMVGWLLAEAVKADVGTYALSNDAFLTDVGLHNAPFGVDIVGHYAQSSFVYQPG